MKKILFLGVLLLVPLIASAQSKEESKAKEPATKLEAFLAKKGRLIIKDSHDLGKISGKYGTEISFTALVIYEPGQESQKTRGLQIKVTEGERYERSNISFLDFEEIESLSKAIEYMVGLSTKWEGIKKEYSEVLFLTKGYFKIGFYQQLTKSEKPQTWNLKPPEIIQSSEQVAFANSGYIGETHSYFSMKDLSSVKDLADIGLKWLSEQ